MNQTIQLNLVTRTEARLRRHLVRWGRARESYAYHVCAGPHYLVSREQFSTIVAKLNEEAFLEIMEGAGQGTIWVVRKDQVDETIKSGVLGEAPARKPLTPECA